ncbi:MAG: C-GCAxxG-C-C family protein [Planctomycetota bacterium]
MKHVTRRQLLVPVGITAGSCVLSSCLSDRVASSGLKSRATDVPWPYEELDPDITADKAYHDFRKGHCMYGVFAPVVSQLAERRGEPYSSFPVGMMRYGAGGTIGSGALCGALNGSAALIGLFAKNEDEVKLLVGEVFLWYEQTALPVYEPAGPVLDMQMQRSVSTSILCHVSVTRWCRTAGFKTFSKQQKERCARLSADTAKKTVEILNARFAGRFSPAHKFEQDVKTCKACHTKGSEKSDSRGKMRCVTCHFSLAAEHP